MQLVAVSNVHLVTPVKVPAFVRVVHKTDRGHGPIQQAAIQEAGVIGRYALLAEQAFKMVGVRNWAHIVKVAA